MMQESLHHNYHREMQRREPDTWNSAREGGAGRRGIATERWREREDTGDSVREIENRRHRGTDVERWREREDTGDSVREGGAGRRGIITDRLRDIATGDSARERERMVQRGSHREKQWSEPDTWNSVREGGLGNKELIGSTALSERKLKYEF